jgi:hypothetical protein
VVQTVGAADRKAQSESVNELIKAFMQSRHYRATLSLLRDTEADGSQLPSPDTVWNGGFELPLAYSDERPFHWMINSSSLAQITADNARPHSGGNSLRVVFKSPNKLESIPISQTVIVQPDTQYKLLFYQRTEGLITASVPVVIVNDSMGKALAASSPLPSGTSDWQQVTLNFKTGPGEDGILITFYRNPCTDKDPICPIFGNIWYDDFNLQRISGAGVAATNARNNSR